MFHIVIEPIKRQMSELLPSEDDNDYTEVFREVLDTECVEFSVGNPRVEHITGIVHLYKRNSTPYGSAAVPQSSTGASQSSAQVCGSLAGVQRRHFVQMECMLLLLHGQRITHSTMHSASQYALPKSIAAV
jgi:hypothetical protein